MTHPWDTWRTERSQPRQIKSDDNDAPAYIYKTTLRQPPVVEQIRWLARLGAPDMEKPNPHYRTGQPSSLYLRARVDVFLEQHADEYAAYLEQRARRSNIASAAAAERRERLVQWARAMPVIVRQLPSTWEELVQEVLEERSWFLARQGREWQIEDEGEVSWGRTLAHLRHQYTNYHSLLASLEGKPGSSEAYAIIKERVNTTVEEAMRKQYG